jgi:hypothetical protein
MELQRSVSSDSMNYYSINRFYCDQNVMLDKADGKLGAK